MKTILITGATGLIGTEITKICHQKGYTVHYLSTSKSKIKKTDNYIGFYWNPSENEIDLRCFEGVTTIINLAGSSVARRWTSSYKKALLESRVKALSLLYDTIKKENLDIEHLISASAIGIYPTSKTNYYTEEADTQDDSFITSLAEQWEATADKFKALDIAVAKIRIGLVLSNQGGALVELKNQISKYVGASLGSGNQWQSWIHIHDLANLFLFILQHKAKGVFNGVAPNPIVHKVLIKEIAKTINRPLWLPAIPKFFLKLVLGEMHVLLTEGQRVSSKKVENLGFQFRYYNVDSALQDLLKR